MISVRFQEIARHALELFEFDTDTIPSCFGETCEIRFSTPGGAMDPENGGAKLVHGGGGIVLLRAA